MFLKKTDALVAEKEKHPAIKSSGSVAFQRFRLSLSRLTHWATPTR